MPFFFILFFLAGAPLWGALTEEQQNEVNQEAKNFKYQVIQSDSGLNFRVPEDMTIEKRNGIEAPVPFDEYMYGKFKQIDGRLEGIEKKLDNIEKVFYPKPELKPEVRPNVLKSEENIPVEKKQS